jgi:hypothetical protein
VNKWISFGVIFLALLLLAVFVYNNLEIYPETVYQPPSRQVQVNDFFALEQWLSRTGHPVRTVKQGNAARIMAAPEKTVYVQAAVFDWDGAREPLKNWMEAGGFLLVSLEYPPEEEALETFLADFGIRVEMAPSGDSDEEGPESEPEDPYPVPDFDQGLLFSAPEGTELIKEGEAVRLVRAAAGAGGLAVFGLPWFMENDYLEREANARLAWELTGARTGESPGLLFIRGKGQVKSLFGKVADRGNLLPPGLSALILIVLGFWMVIPRFGLVFQEHDSPGRPPGDRFLAEVRFLKKYGALDSYAKTYVRELRLKLRDRAPPPELEHIEAALHTGRTLPYKDLVRYLHILGTMMEKL